MLSEDKIDDFSAEEADADCVETGFLHLIFFSTIVNCFRLCVQNFRIVLLPENRYRGFRGHPSKNRKWQLASSSVLFNLLLFVTLVMIGWKLTIEGTFWWAINFRNVWETNIAIITMHTMTLRRYRISTYKFLDMIISSNWF